MLRYSQFLENADLVNISGKISGDVMGISQFRSRKVQSGHFLIHLAEVFVSAGLVVGVAMQGSVYLEKMEHQTVYKDLKTIENSLWEYRESNGAWLDQCENSSGQITGTDLVFPCGQDIISLINKLNAKAIKKGNMQFDIKLIKLPNDAVKRAIIIENTPTDLAEWLNKKIDGDMPLNEGRVRYIANQSSQIAYLYESSLL